MAGGYKESNVTFAKPIVAELAKALEMSREERVKEYGTLGLTLMVGKLHELLFWHND